MKNPISVLVALALALLPFSAQATLYTWTGATSTAWDLNTNWGGAAFPNSYGDQATIPASPTSNRRPVLSTTALLGGATTALTLTGSGSGSTITGLDISGTGVLGMQGGISIGSRRALSIEGILRNDAVSSATTYTISGAPTLNGGTISSLNGGVWNLANGVSGWGTISAPITTAASISDTVANQTLHITGNVTSTLQRGIGGNSYVSGALLSIEGGTIYGGAATNGLEGGISNYNRVNLRGNFNNIQLFNDGNYNQATPGDWNYYNLTGNSTWNNGALNIINFNGYKLDVTGTVTNYASSGLGVNVGSGTLNNPGTSLSTISNGNFLTLAGGQITGAAGSTGFSLGTNLRGYGTISTPVTFAPNGGLGVSGGIFNINNTTVDSLQGSFVTVASNSTMNINNSTLKFNNFNNSGILNNAANSTMTGTQAFVQSSANSKTINNGILTAGSVDIQNGILGGSGTINALVTIESGATLSPGNSPGTLTINGDFSSAGNMLFEIAGLNSGDYDKLRIFGNASVTGGIIEFDFNFQALAGESWDFFDATTISLWNPASYKYVGLGAGLIARVIPETYDGSVGERLVVLQDPAAATPEPGTMVLFGAGLLGLGVLRFRRKAAA